MEFKEEIGKPPEGPLVGGLRETVRALNEGRVQRLIVCASFASSDGWQCLNCLALHVELDAPPETCSHCGSSQLQAVDLKTAIIARAYQLGSSVEIVSRSLELERVGAIGALLHE
jgi:peptide subunit release factor 1 (eRF1)